jgi:hypothetical protein
MQTGRLAQQVLTMQEMVFQEGIHRPAPSHVICAALHVLIGPAACCLVTAQVFLDISIKGQHIGRILISLFAKTSPRAAENFRQLCTGEAGVVPPGHEGAGSRYHLKAGVCISLLPGLLMIKHWVMQMSLEVTRRTLQLQRDAVRARCSNACAHICSASHASFHAGHSFLPHH